MSNSEKDRNRGRGIGSPYNIQTHPNTEASVNSKDKKENKNIMIEESDGVRAIGGA